MYGYTMTAFFYMFLGFFVFSYVQSIMFHLHPNTQRCLQEELRKDEIVRGEFQVSTVEGQQTDYSVRDSKGHILAQNTNISKGKFSFSTEDEDIFEVCFKSHPPQNKQSVIQEVLLNLKRGGESKSYEAIAKSGNLKPLEIELKKLEDVSYSIVDDFIDLRQRELAMRNTNESTNNRVFYLSILSMVCLLSLSAWQVLYLKKFFRSRKLIE